MPGDGARTSDPRPCPVIVLDADQLRAMLRPLLGSARVREVQRVEGGLVNTIYRVTADGAAYSVRIYAGGQAAFERERRLLAALSGRLPVPEVLLADPGGESCAHPFVVYRWMEGVTLNDFRRRAAPGELEGLAEPLGSLAARIAGVPADEITGLKLDVVDIAVELDLAERQLRSGRARVRLGETLADGLRERLAAGEPQLLALDGSRGLLHGDFGGRNVLVRAGKAGAWEISGLLDWETAAQGAAPWDVGSLFRYTQRYSPDFRDAFARGYRAAGGALESGWGRAARLLDATRLVRILGEDRELPSVFAECRGLIASMLDAECAE